MMNEPQNSTDTEDIGPGLHVTGPGASLATVAAIPMARQSIEARIGRLREEAANLEALLGALPSVLPAAADEALWDLVSGRGR